MLHEIMAMVHKIIVFVGALMFIGAVGWAVLIAGVLLAIPVLANIEAIRKALAWIIIGIGLIALMAIGLAPFFQTG
jgi:hypothetical protein